MIDGILQALVGALSEALGLDRIQTSGWFAALCALICVQVFADGVLAWSLTCAIALASLAYFKRTRRTKQLNGVIYMLVAEVQIAFIYGGLLFTHGHPMVAIVGSAAWMIAAVVISLAVPGADPVDPEPVEIGNV